MPECTACYKTQADNQFINLVTGGPARVCLTCRQRRVASTKRRWKERQEYNRKVAYGLEAGQYDRMLAEQNGVCAICGRPPGEHATYKVLAVDHDKESKVVRGLLCPQCNVGIGMFKHDTNLLIKALKYLGFRDPIDAGT